MKRWMFGMSLFIAYLFMSNSTPIPDYTSDIILDLINKKYDRFHADVSHSHGPVPHGSVQNEAVTNWGADEDWFLPERSVLDGTRTDEVLPDGSVTDGSLPDGSDESNPGGPVTDGTLPDRPFIDGSLPDVSVTNGSLEDQSIYAGSLPNRSVTDESHLVESEPLPTDTLPKSSVVLPQNERSYQEFTYINPYITKTELQDREEGLLNFGSMSYIATLLKCVYTEVTIPSTVLLNKYGLQTYAKYLLDDTVKTFFQEANLIPGSSEPDIEDLVTVRRLQYCISGMSGNDKSYVEGRDGGGYGHGGGYGKDKGSNSILGFALLGLKVVGGLAAFLWWDLNM